VNPHQVNGTTPKRLSPRVNVLQALLDLALVASSPPQAFDVRLAATECIKAYLYGHAQIRVFFLRRAIEGHVSEIYEADNIFTILVKDSESRHPDPYRHWIASVLLFHLLYEDVEAKNTAMAVTDGNAEDGEEVITCIQALSGNIITSARKGDDERVTIGYLMILCGWLYEDHGAVNDFLGEGSNVQSIIQLVIQDNHSQPLVSGLCAFLLGIIYEFSTKDSPIPRETLHQILTTGLGREQYYDRITKLREHPTIRDYEVSHQGYDSTSPGSLPQVYFDRTFVEFLKDNFSRILRAIDRAPGIEVPVIANGIHQGISRELVDSLRAQVEDRSSVVQKLESDLLTVERKLNQEQADHRKGKESAEIELIRIKNINEALQRNHDDDLLKIDKRNRATQLEAQKTHLATVSSLQSELQRIKDENEAAATRIRERTDAEIDDLKSTIRRLEDEIAKINRDHIQDLQTAHEEYSTKLTRLESKLARAEDKGKDSEARATRLGEQLEKTESSRVMTQTELDDLLMVLGDLEEKRLQDKVGKS
jgi:intracellular protein transport protein USO1